MADDHERIASVILHPNEEGYIAALEPVWRPGAFAHCWARKEAVLKAIGAGFEKDPRSFDVRPAEPAAHIDAEGSWYLHDLPTEEVAAAVAARDRSCAWLTIQLPL